MRSASCCLPPSIRERIEPEPVADAAPEIGKAVGLENEEEHDGQAEDGELEGGEELHQMREASGHRAGSESEPFGKQGEEHGAVDRSEEPDEPTDDEQYQG